MNYQEIKKPRSYENLGSVEMYFQRTTYTERIRNLSRYLRLALNKVESYVERRISPNTEFWISLGPGTSAVLTLMAASETGRETLGLAGFFIQFFLGFGLCSHALSRKEKQKRRK